MPKAQRNKPVPAGRGKAPRPEALLPGPVAVIEPEALPRVEEWVQVPCPFCGEEIEVFVRSDEDGQTRCEECAVCCRSVSLHITWEDGELQVESGRA